ncbi:COMM domain containing 10 protein valette [Anticarsia gemmatalis]|uniref:COMM domain containing 10 protein valette n=1 Tax=Anticarsia gemmatalis TaxID=129554 RepID=UPI003F76D83D
MECHWLKLSPSLSKGLAIINKIDETRFEQYARRIVAKLKLQDTEIFTEEERLKLEKIFSVDQESLILSIKTLQYIFKRALKYIFMPNDLKSDLKSIGLNNDKADAIVKVWSAETRTTLNEIGSITSDQSDSLNFSWKLNAELSSDVHKKCKIPKAYISLNRENSESEMELTHAELYSMFLQFECIQNELDNLIM